jgi:hypothetical protein
LFSATSNRVFLHKTRRVLLPAGNAEALVPTAPVGLAEVVCFNHSADAHVIDTAFRSFFDTCHTGSPADECMGASFPGGHNRKSDFRSYTQPLANPEVKAASRNIACPSKDWLEFPESEIEPDFDRKD